MNRSVYRCYLLCLLIAAWPGCVCFRSESADSQGCSLHNNDDAGSSGCGSAEIVCVRDIDCPPSELCVADDSGDAMSCEPAADVCATDQDCPMNALCNIASADSGARSRCESLDGAIRCDGSHPCPSGQTCVHGDEHDLCEAIDAAVDAAQDAGGDAPGADAIDDGVSIDQASDQQVLFDDGTVDATQEPELEAGDEPDGVAE